MQSKWAIISSGAGAAASFLTYLVGGWDYALSTMVIFICIDYITGLMSGFITGELSSNRGAKGIAKKCLYLIIVTIASLLDETAKAEGLIRNTVIYFFIANEGLSIIENAAACGLPIPKVLRVKLVQLKEPEDSENVREK